MQAISLIVLLVVGLCSARKPVGSRGCPNVEVMQNFEVTKYLGTWYENRKFTANYEAGGKCNKAEYSATSETGVVAVRNSQIMVLSSSAAAVRGSAKLDSNNGEAKLTVTLFDEDTPYWVLGTDYETYASVWSCGGDGRLANDEFGWILTRDRYPSEEVITNALTHFELNNIDTSKFRITDQAGCTN